MSTKPKFTDLNMLVNSESLFRPDDGKTYMTHNLTVKALLVTLLNY